MDRVPNPCPQPGETCHQSKWLRQGMCDKHYRRYVRHGDPTFRQRIRSDSPNDWASKIHVNQCGCWEWTAYVDHQGYGKFMGPNHQTRRAHRYVYQELVRELARTEHLDHLCRNRRCVNPDHLDVVEHVVNVRRGVAGINNSRKTHCKYGHEFTPSNTIRNSLGQRNCKECTRRIARQNTRRWRGTPDDAVPNAEKTHCKQGHEFTPGNTYVRKGGGRSCRECVRQSQARYKARKRAAVTTT